MFDLEQFRNAANDALLKLQALPSPTLEEAAAIVELTALVEALSA